MHYPRIAAGFACRLGLLHTIEVKTEALQGVRGAYRVWIDGGQAVDVLLGVQTRPQ